MPDVSSLERIIREHCDEGDSRLKTLGFVGTSEIQLMLRMLMILVKVFVRI